MKFLSEMEKPRARLTPKHRFQSEHTAIEYLKGYAITTWPGEKRFDALDYLMYTHHYQVQLV